MEFNNLLDVLNNNKPLLAFVYIILSFTSAFLIDQIFMYTTPRELEHARLKNPIQLTDQWTVLDEELLGDDQLIVAEKGVECIQEL